MIFFALLFVPVLIALGAYLLGRGRVTIGEFVIQLVAQCVVAGASAAVIYYGNTADLETWNGRVASKKQEWVSCQHS